jgi:hypothetical protein
VDPVEIGTAEEEIAEEAKWAETVQQDIGLGGRRLEHFQLIADYDVGGVGQLFEQPQIGGMRLGEHEQSDRVHKKG